MILALSAAPAGICQTSYWSSSAVPGTPEAGATPSVTLGLQFTSDVSGSVTGVRFYKGPHNLGTHVGTLWTGGGAKLAEVTFTGETASGWQQANFAAPVNISPNTPYVISYLAPAGNYAFDSSFPWSSPRPGPLHVSGGSPGVFSFASGVSFPASSYLSGNYWVDLVFVPANTYWGSAVPGTQEAGATPSVTLGMRFTSDVPGSVTGVRFYKGPHNLGTHIGTLWSGGGSKLAEVIFSGETGSGWQQANFSTPVTITANTPYVISYLAPAGNYAFDSFFPWSNPQAGPLHASGSSPGVFSFGSGVSFPGSSYLSGNYWVDLVFVPTSTTYWTSSAVPGTPEMGATPSVTLGLQFYADVPGLVTGVRFYKGPHNLGTHVGTLWSGAGAKLAEIAFSGESASGWQQANFATPVNIAANTPYVISYLAPQGSYPFDSNFSWSSPHTGPLHVSGSSPGVFSFASGVSFPTNSYLSGNYWVDVVFVPTSGSTAPISSPISSPLVPPLQTPVLHTVTVSWTPSISPSISGYNIYRSTTSGGPYNKLNLLPILTTSYLDAVVVAGQTYYYVATTVQLTNESGYSAQTAAVVPSP